jgi:membrane fusion protein (multidrug efflux system)
MLDYLQKTLQAIVLILILAFFISMLASCGTNQAQQPGGSGAVPVATATVALSKADYHSSYPGTVIALNQIDLRPQASGYITGIFFKDGDRVTKGQKLYTIDAQMYAANYDQALANISVQETNLAKAQKDADRYHELAKNDAIAKQQVDYADAALESAKTQLVAAKANAKGVQTGVKYTTIFAPFTGTIGISQVKEGTAVTAGVTLLNTISTDNPMAVDFSIDQKEIYRFTTLQQKQTNADSTFTIAFGENEVYPYTGKISLLDRAVDPQTGTLKVRLDFPNTKNLLRAGMSCTVRVANSSAEQVIVIPAKAVTEQLGDYFVYIVGEGNKVSQHKVTPGSYIGSDVIIKDGLKENDVIVTDGVQKLREGSLIETDVKAAK